VPPIDDCNYGQPHELVECRPKRFVAARADADRIGAVVALGRAAPTRTCGITGGIARMHLDAAPEARSMAAQGLANG